MSCIVLLGGTVLKHGVDDSIEVTKADIVIQDDRIVALGAEVDVPADAQVLDCTDKIITPGLISTHNHLWEVPLKGICEDLKAVPYFATMFTAGLSLNSQDVFWGSLAGALDAINAGTTTVLDFAHGNWSSEHGKQTIAGTLTSGIRGVHAFAPAIQIAQTRPKVEIGKLIPHWFIPTLGTIVKSIAGSQWQSRLQIGLGFDYFFLDKGTVLDVFDRAKALGMTTFTSHGARLPRSNDSGLPALLADYGLLRPGYVISHMTGATQNDIDLLDETGAHISASPTMELAMGMGTPVCFRRDVRRTHHVCSLGADCMYSSIVNEMRVGLQAARACDVTSPEVRSCREAFNLGTIQGARALKLDQDIGSIAVGKKADLVIWEATSPAMLAAAQADPVKAIVMHSSPADIRTVIIDGKLRKKDGRLVSFHPVEWQEEHEMFIEATSPLTWEDIVQPVLEVQKKFVHGWSGIDFVSLEKFVVELYGM